MTTPFLVRLVPLLFFVFFAFYEPTEAQNLAFSTSTTYTEQEIDAFRQLRNRHVRAIASSRLDSLRIVADAITAHLIRYPRTVNRRAALRSLFEAGVKLGAPCDSLRDIADEILIADPAHYNHHVAARGLLESGCNLGFAETAAREAIHSLPHRSSWHHPEYHQTLGRVLLAKDRVLEAAETFEAGLRLIEDGLIDDHHLYVAYIRRALAEDLARAYLLASDLDAAVRLYTDLYEMYPNEEMFAEALEASLALTGREAAGRAVDATYQALLAEMKAEVTASPLDEQAPSFSLPSITGGAVGLDNLSGKVTVIAFWTSWCSPCIAEMALLVELYATHHEDNFEILGIHLPMEQPDWDLKQRYRRLLADHGITFPVLQGDVQVARAYGVPPLPQTVVLDRQGRIRYRHIGYDEDTLIRERIRLEVNYLLRSSE